MAAGSAAVDSGYADVLAIVNATIVTMASGAYDRDVVHGGVLLVQDGVFTRVGIAQDVKVPEGANIINANGSASRGHRRHDCGSLALARRRCSGFLGHPWYEAVNVISTVVTLRAAHWGGSWTHPAKNWEHEAFLAYGVTTLHKFIKGDYLAMLSQLTLPAVLPTTTKKGSSNVSSPREAA